MVAVVVVVTHVHTAQDGSGTIDADECMEILYKRFRGESMDSIQKKAREFMRLGSGPASP